MATSKKRSVALALPQALREFAALKPRAEKLERKEEQKFYFDLKEQVWDFERNNLRYIVFYHRDHQWWQCGDNSMLFYYHWVTPQLKLKNIQIRHDTDYTDKKWKYGYITVSNIDRVIENLRGLKYKLAVDTAEVKVFDLAKTLTSEEMEVWRNAEAEKEARFNHLVVPKNAYPRILNKAAILHREVINKTVNLSPARQKYYGDQGAELASWLSYYGIAMANGRMDVKTYFRTAIDKLNQMNDWLAYAKKFDLFNLDTDIRIADGIHELRGLMEMELAFLERGKKSDGAER